jgi:hypothetical protein
MATRIVFLKGILTTLRAGQLIVPEKVLRQTIDIQILVHIAVNKNERAVSPSQKQDQIITLSPPNLTVLKRRQLS